MSREAVLAAAKQHFAAHGYDKATLRAIARDAQVDPSMVLYLVGLGPEQVQHHRRVDLFRESLRLLIDPAQLVAAMTAAEGDIGSRLVRRYLQIWESPETADSMVAMLQSATSNPDANEALRSFMQSYVLTAVSGVIGGDAQARLRAMLAATNLLGTALLRYVMKVSPLADLPAEDIVNLVGPTVTRYLTASSAELGLPE